MQVLNQCHGTEPIALVALVDGDDAGVTHIDGWVKGECGSAEEHSAHDFPDTARVCSGGAPWVVADCGHPFRHGEHPMIELPEEML